MFRSSMCLLVIVPHYKSKCYTVKSRNLLSKSVQCLYQEKLTWIICISIQGSFAVLYPNTSTLIKLQLTGKFSIPQKITVLCHHVLL